MKQASDSFGQPAVQLGTARMSSNNMVIGTTTREGKEFAERQVLDPSNTTECEEEYAGRQDADGIVSTDAAQHEMVD